MQKLSGQSAVYDEPADWIVGQARQVGVSISRGQLADWHRAGLIAKPNREFPGGRDGSELIYPHGTLDQAIACAILMKRFGSVERVGWELWMRGRKVAECYWRTALIGAHEDFVSLSKKVTEPPEADDNGPPQLNRDADDLIAMIAERAEAPRRMGIARRRLGSERLKEFLSIVLSAAIGGFSLTERSKHETLDPVSVFARLVGTKPAQHKAAPPHSPLLQVTGEAVVENLLAMVDGLSRIPAITLKEISEAELASARGELAFLLKAFLAVRENEARIVPGSTPDLALIRQLFEDLGPKEQATRLLIWLAVRDIPGWRENLEALRQLVIAELTKGK